MPNMAFWDVHWGDPVSFSVQIDSVYRALHLGVDNREVTYGIGDAII